MASSHLLLNRPPTTMGCPVRQRQPSRRALSVRAGDGAQSKGFGSPAAKPSPPPALKAPTPSPAANPPPAGPSTTSTSSKASMDEYRSVLAAEEAAKARRRAPAASTSGRPARPAPEPVATTPTVVSDRMLQRIILFSGVPVFVGFLLYPLFYYLKVVQGVDLPMSVVYSVQLFTFGAGLAGITYAVMSTSWDPNQPGSLLGWTEFQGNLPLLLDRFKRRD